MSLSKFFAGLFKKKPLAPASVPLPVIQPPAIDWPLPAEPEPVPVPVSKYNGEQVLCFYANLLDFLGTFQGIIADPAEIFRYRSAILTPENLFYVDRDRAEKDPKLKQLIPYTILRRNNHVFCYQRTKKGGESRLHDKWSVGVGGHINPADGEPGEAYDIAFWRELNEEVSLRMMRSSNIVGLINDDSDDVGKVHFGIVHQIQVGFAPLSFRDPAVENGKFLPVSQHRSLLDRYENWSQLVIENLL